MNTKIILGKAIETAKRENKAYYILVKTLGKKNEQTVSFLLYYFLRWLDDNIDENDFSKKQNLKFLKRERKVIVDIFSGKEMKTLNEYELAILLMKNLDHKTAVKIKKYVIDNYLKAFELEQKRPQIITKKWLEKYAYYVGGSFANIGIVIANPDLDPKIINGISRTCGSAADLTHLLRDFRKDLANKKINISKEDMIRFKIKKTELDKNSEELQAFAKSQTDKIFKLFSRGEKYIKSVSSFRLRLAAALFISKYKFVLLKIRDRNYNLLSNYENSNLVEKIKGMVLIFRHFLKLAF